jgi:enamine deaminase RidA (YjgF/YER057c/UK114 family)
MAEAFNAPGVAKPFGIFSTAAWQGGGEALHIAGTVSQDADGKPVAVGDIAGQTRQTLKNIRTVLDSVGGRMEDIVSVIVYVTEMSGLREIHEVRAEFFKPPYPASTLVQVQALVKPEYLIEISAIASIPKSRAKRPS